MGLCVTPFIIIKFFFMKRLFISLSLILFIAVLAFAQTPTKIKVAGNCGMCKSHIEKAAKEAGATSAEWNKATKVLSVVFDANTTSADKIESSIASAGYDTEHQTASAEAYSKLDECCQYDRVAKATKDAACCKDGTCSKKGADCCKKDTACCDKSIKGVKKDMSCCKDGSCCKKA